MAALSVEAFAKERKKMWIGYNKKKGQMEFESKNRFHEVWFQGVSMSTTFTRGIIQHNIYRNKQQTTGEF